MFYLSSNHVVIFNRMSREDPVLLLRKLMKILMNSNHVQGSVQVTVVELVARQNDDVPLMI